jgi:hypothetical protein
MNRKRILVVCMGLALAMLVRPTLINAQQVAGTPGTPGATTTISGKQLPPPVNKPSGTTRSASNTRVT